MSNIHQNQSGLGESEDGSQYDPSTMLSLSLPCGYYTAYHYDITVWYPVSCDVVLYQRLKAFRAKYGHCNVPYYFPPDLVLGRWVSVQRYKYELLTTAEEGELSALDPEMQAMLEDIGFEWDAKNAIWDETYFQAAESYMTGSLTSENLDENPSLKSWLVEQKEQYILFRNGEETKLSQEQVRKLEDIQIHLID
eukprot:CAMPEP_0178949850 /NCGR_PEP_ID=MMETSP0789-20121207/6301_1 /TAXON_ID=3005 /ORGANISM="Rhizosolenia setigera, Strain CCMP 1694" /LENGTH=193 /DNA_ID=CAMNT_0020630461 /DNA_START=108 /DNA_END=689 /DNA_ORIENTATION=+